LREEHRLGVFVKRVLRITFGPKMDEATGGCIKLHNEELCDLFSLPCVIRFIKSRRMKRARHVARVEKRNSYSLLVGKQEGKRRLGAQRRKWMDKIKMDLVEVGFDVVDWISLAQERYRWRGLVNAVMNIRAP
jgi:hypothetical protein